MLIMNTFSLQEKVHSASTLYEVGHAIRSFFGKQPFYRSSKVFRTPTFSDVRPCPLSICSEKRWKFYNSVEEGINRLLTLDAEERDYVTESVMHFFFLFLHLASFKKISAIMI